VPREGQEHHDEVRRHRAILPADLGEDPAYALNSNNWISFGVWDFDAHYRAGYLGDLDYFYCEIVTEEDENDNEDAAEADCETSPDGPVQGGTMTLTTVG
jgi:hypothetical protein